jgi:hypothetical protein
MRLATGVVYAFLFLVLIAVTIFVVVWGDEETLGLTSPVGTTAWGAGEARARTPVVGTTASLYEQSPAPIPVCGTMFLTEVTCATDGVVMGDTHQIRQERWIMRYQMSDERVDGGQDMVINVDQSAGGSADCWGTAAITNNRGSWECSAYSAYTANIAGDGLEHFVWAVYEGTGAYSGLTYHMQAHFERALGAGGLSGEGIAVAGWIQAGG